MIRCRHCHSEANDDNVECPSCGQPFDKTGSKSSPLHLQQPTVVAPEPRAEEIQETRCLRCGKLMPAHFKVCPHCRGTQESFAAHASAGQRRKRAAEGFRTFIVLLFLGGLAALIWLWPDQSRGLWLAVKEKAAALAPSRREEPAPAVGRPAPARQRLAAPGRSKPIRKESRYTEYNCVCPACSGEGYYARNQHQRKSCPVCRSRGRVARKLKAGWTVCPKCRGIGRIEESRRASGGIKRACECPLCGGSGAVRK